MQNERKKGDTHHCVSPLDILFVQQLFQGSQLQTDGQYFHGSNAQMIVSGVVAIGIGSTGIGQGDTGLLAQLPGALGSTVHGVQADKISALGFYPFADSGRLDLLIQPLGNAAELGGHDTGMALHDLKGMCFVL